MNGRCAPYSAQNRHQSRLKLLDLARFNKLFIYSKKVYNLRKSGNLPLDFVVKIT